MRGLDPIAWLLTWPTYGNWLHGDQRDSWNRKAVPPFSGFTAPNVRLEALRRSQLAHSPAVITPAMRRIIREAFEEHCTFRGWRLFAQSIRTNHVHVVIANHVDGPARLIQSLKGRSTRLLRERGLVDTTQPVWARGAGRSWLMCDADLNAAIQYVLYGQGVDLPEE